MRQCRNGHPVDDGVNFCPSCGAPVERQGGYEDYRHAYDNERQRAYGGRTNRQQLTGFRGVVRSPGSVIILSIITCGIYGIYWQYSVAKEINEVLGHEATQPSYALIGILCFVFSFILMYQMDNAVMEIDAKQGKPSNSNFLMWIILSIFFGIGFFMMQYQVQSRLNALYEGRY